MKPLLRILCLVLIGFVTCCFRQGFEQPGARDESVEEVLDLDFNRVEDLAFLDSGDGSQETAFVDAGHDIGQEGTDGDYNLPGDDGGQDDSPMNCAGQPPTVEQEELVINATTGGEQTMPVVVALGSGNALIAYESETIDGDLEGIAAVMVDSTLRVVVPEWIVNQTSAGSQTLPYADGLSDGGFVVVWSGSGSGDDQGVFARIYAADGSPRGNEILVNSVRTEGKQTGGRVTALDDGRFAVMWWVDSSDQLALRIFDGTGAARSGEIDLAFSPHDHEGSTFLSSVDMLANQDIVVTWTTWCPIGEDGSGCGVVHRLMAPDGTPRGDSRLVNIQTEGDQTTPTVLALPDGGYVVAWTDFNVNGGDVVMRLFDSSGVPRTGELSLAQSVSGPQAYARLFVTPDGGFTALWGTGSEPISVLRSFDPEGNPTSDELEVFDLPVGGQPSANGAARQDSKTWIVYQDSTGVDGDGSGILATTYGCLGPSVFNAVHPPCH